MLSRVAHSIYWLGRYLERAENYARFIDVNFNLMLDLPPGSKEQWRPLIIATGDEALYLEHHDTFDRQSAIHFLAFEEKNPNSLISSISKARENARVIRENLPRDTWEILNETYYFVNDRMHDRVRLQGNPRNFFNDVKTKIQTLYGVEYNSMARTEAWYFKQLGTYLERADKTSRILDVKYHILLPSPQEVGSTLDVLHWMALLRSVSGYNTYRRLYGNIDPSGIVDFLVLNRYFPRSILFSLYKSEQSLKKISGTSSSGFTNRAEKNMGGLRSQLEYADVLDVIGGGLHEYLDGLQSQMNGISNAIYDIYFKIQHNTSEQISIQE